jgi:hypothetical protein
LKEKIIGGNCRTNGFSWKNKKTPKKSKYFPQRVKNFIKKNSSAIYVGVTAAGLPDGIFSNQKSQFG